MVDSYCKVFSYAKIRNISCRNMANALHALHKGEKDGKMFQYLDMGDNIWPPMK